MMAGNLTLGLVSIFYGHRNTDPYWPGILTLAAKVYQPRAVQGTLASVLRVSVVTKGSYVNQRSHGNSEAKAGWWQIQWRESVLWTFWSPYPALQQVPLTIYPMSLWPVTQYVSFQQFFAYSGSLISRGRFLLCWISSNLQIGTNKVKFIQTWKHRFGWNKAKQKQTQKQKTMLYKWVILLATCSRQELILLLLTLSPKLPLFQTFHGYQDLKNLEEIFPKVHV